MTWQTGPDGINRWESPAPRNTLAALAAAAPGLQQTPAAAAPPAASSDSWRPQYGSFPFTGTGALVRLGRESFQLPQGWQVAPLDDAVLVALDPADHLFLLTAEGAVANLTPAAASALGSRLFDCREATPG